MPPVGKSDSDFENAKATGIDPVACSLEPACSARGFELVRVYERLAERVAYTGSG